MYTYKENEKLLVWSMAATVPGYNSAKYRKDTCGAWICYESFGDRNSKYGWEIDHIFPTAKGGNHHISNVQPLHWKNNLAKADGNQVCVVFA